MSYISLADKRNPFFFMSWILSLIRDGSHIPSSAIRVVAKKSDEIKNSKRRFILDNVIY